MKTLSLKNRKVNKLNLRFSTAILSLATALISFSAISQNVGISPTGTPPDASAGLDIAFSDRGVLVPRMGVINRDNINAPANGLIIYNTDCNLLNYYDCNTWREVGKFFDFPNLTGTTEVVNGKANPSENETGVIYSVPPIPGASNYTWTVPPGATVTAGQGTYKATVSFTTPGDDYVCVEAVNSCGTLVKACLFVTICPLPAQPGVIAGDATPNENSAGNTYSISAVPSANTYTWTVPIGATITAGQGTTSISVDFALGASNGNICVAANSDCGTGTTQCLALTMQCPTPTVPTANVGTNINATDFDANWSASSGVTDYYLDVSTDVNFGSFVSGFNNLNVSNVTTYNVTGLTCETDYYYRVRAENPCGTTISSNVETVTMGSCWSCGGAMTDSRDSKTYQTVQIGSQCWMKENLNYTPGSGNSWCYDNNPSNCTTYGRLYDWTTAMAGSSSSSSNPSNVQGICPAGWHFPSDVEWCQLENEIEPGLDACNKTGWRGTYASIHIRTSSWGGDNTSGFTALPGGGYNGSAFHEISTYAFFWSATEVDGANAWRRFPSSGTSGVYRGGYNKTVASSVRCIKD